MLKRISFVLALLLALAPVVVGQEEHTPASLQQLVPESGGWGQAAVTAGWTIVIFVIMLIILYPTAWKQVLAGLKKREERIRQDIAGAEAARERAEATLREYNAQLAAAEARGREILNKATTDAEALAATIRNRAQKESEEIQERSKRDIEAASRQAIADIHRQAADLATLVAEKILRRNLNAADQEDLVRQSLDQMQAVSKN
jgi:F-type H+-transporting ATPase subunit b